ncbi:serine/threonine-protein kinase [Nocardiopsis synnemataformans]|uniref:serine/threonine-protein kinase n=1 Tax=Nocardiopsis synnemataformans TaxID=61305 RepID=UPI003EBFF446
MSTGSLTVLLPTTVADLAPDDPVRIGRYRLLKRLGAGGMGLVYAARDEGGGLVAVKLIHPEYASAADFRARFAREVDLLGRVGGACAVPLLDADTEAARPWLATPLVRGMTLSDYLRRHGPLGEELLRGLAVGVAEALTQIHEAGIAHRDLKPSNIVLSPEGPRVLDFGVARAIDQTAITRTGMLSGSPGWISPEHYRGEPVSTSDDVFAWGALVVYAATGRPPFGTGNAAAVAHRVLDSPPDTDGFSGPLADLALRALSKHAADRPTALELVHGVVQTASPGRAIAPIRDVGTAAAATAGVLDRDWHGVRTGAEREYEIPATGEGRGGRRVLALTGAALGALVLLAGLVAGGVALGGDWENLPMAAWFSGEEEQTETVAREPSEEERVPGPVSREEPTEEPSEEPSEEPGQEPSEEPSEEPEETEEPEEEPEPEAPAPPPTVPLTVFNAEGPCQTSRAPECGLRLVHDPHAPYADPGNRAGQVWHGDVLQTSCLVPNGVTVTDESGTSTSTMYRVTAGATTGWLPGARTRDDPQVPVC